MSEPVTIWTSNPTGTTYLHPDGYGRGRAYGTSRVDDLRRAKHLTDAELAAEYWSATARLFAQGKIDRQNTLLRFATHDQAV